MSDSVAGMLGDVAILEKAVTAEQMVDIVNRALKVDQSDRMG